MINLASRGKKERRKRGMVRAEQAELGKKERVHGPIRGSPKTSSTTLPRKKPETEGKTTLEILAPARGGI